MRAVSVLAVALALNACASNPKAGAPATPIPGPEVLGLVGPMVPQTLQRVSKTPYAVPEPRTCEEIARQIAELDALLGPDVDARGGEGEDEISQWAWGAVRGLVPYRSVVRFVTQASAKERELAKALIAGAARRGYLKGVRETLPCPTDPAALDGAAGGAH